jgi:predicted transcriptional regulator
MDQPFINDSVTQDPSLDEYHRTLIEEGIRQDDAGEVLEHQKVLDMVARRVPPLKTD